MTAPARGSKRLLYLSWGVAAAFAAAAGAAALRARAPLPAPFRRFELPAVMAASSASPALAPDGTRIAYLADEHLHVRVVDSLEARDLGPVPKNASMLFWSPDSRTIGFSAEGTIRSVPAAGGPFLSICKIPASGRAMGVRWQKDGTIVFSVWRDSLYRVPASGGVPQVHLAIDPSKEVDFHLVSALPDGRLLINAHPIPPASIAREPLVAAFALEHSEIYDGKRRSVLSTAGSIHGMEYAPPGFLLFMRTDANANEGLWSLPFTEGPLDPSKAVLIEPRATGFDVAADGTLLALVPPESASKVELVWVDRSGAVVPVPGAPVPGVPAELGALSAAAVSPDGRRAAFAAGSPADVFLRDLATGLDTRLTFDAPGARAVAWFPSGDRILYGAGTAVGALKIVSRRADGTAETRELASGVFARVSADGRSLFFSMDDRGRGHLRQAPLSSDGTLGTAQPVFSGGDEPDIRGFDLSPDGSLLVYSVRQPSLQVEVFLTELPAGKSRVQISNGGGAQPRFSRDGKELFYLSPAPDGKGRQLTAVPVTSRPEVKLGAPRALFGIDGGKNGPSSRAGYDVSQDGRRFLMTRPLSPAGSDGTRLVLVQNWPAAMAKER